jgi:glycine cleavage system H protein
MERNPEPLLNTHLQFIHSDFLRLLLKTGRWLCALIELRSFNSVAEISFRAMNIPNELKYAVTHEWIRQEADRSLAVGITDHAQDLLGDLVFVQLPTVGQKVKAGAAICVLESVKTAADVHAPVNGTIIAINTVLQDAPERINQDSYAAWLFCVLPENMADYAALLNATCYKAVVDAG